MILDVVLEFMIDLLKTLLVEELGRRVQKHGARLVERRRQRRLIRQALHRLTTEREAKR